MKDDRQTKNEKYENTTRKQYIDNGADMVIGTHAHVLQGIEFYNNKPIKATAKEINLR